MMMVMAVIVMMRCIGMMVVIMVSFRFLVKVYGFLIGITSTDLASSTGLASFRISGANNFSLGSNRRRCK